MDEAEKIFYGPGHIGQPVGLEFWQIEDNVGIEKGPGDLKALVLARAVM